MGAGVLHLAGPVVVGDDDVRAQAWVADGRLTFEAPPAGVDALRVEGWVLPGLVDVHCHVGLDGRGEDARADAAATERQAVADRDAGVLAIRDAGSPADTRWVDARDDLPRLVRAGRHLARPKRYLRGFARELADVAELPAAAAEEARRGDGWVKIVADWIDRDLGPHGDLRPLWPDDVLAEAIAAAHGAGARVTAHTFSTEALAALLAGGVDGIEHGTGLTPSMIDEVARLRVPVTPTLLQVAQFPRIAEQADGKYPLFAARMRHLHARRYRHVADLHDAGVPLLVGTDAGGTIAHGRIADEIAEIVRAGVPAADAVASASWRARAFLGLAGAQEGASADVVVYPEDPRADPAVLAHPGAVVLRGHLLAR